MLDLRRDHDPQRRLLQVHELRQHQRLRVKSACGHTGPGVMAPGLFCLDPSVLVPGCVCFGCRSATARAHENRESEEQHGMRSDRVSAREHARAQAPRPKHPSTQTRNETPPTAPLENLERRVGLGKIACTDDIFTRTRMSPITAGALFSQLPTMTISRSPSLCRPGESRMMAQLHVAALRLKEVGECGSGMLSLTLLMMLALVGVGGGADADHDRRHRRRGRRRQRRGAAWRRRRGPQRRDQSHPHAGDRSRGTFRGAAAAVRAATRSPSSCPDSPRWCRRTSRSRSASRRD